MCPHILKKRIFLIALKNWIKIMFQHCFNIVLKQFKDATYLQINLQQRPR